MKTEYRLVDQDGKDATKVVDFDDAKKMLEWLNDGTSAGEYHLQTRTCTEWADA